MQDYLIRQGYFPVVLLDLVVRSRRIWIAPFRPREASGHDLECGLQPAYERVFKQSPVNLPALPFVGIIFNPGSNSGTIVSESIPCFPKRLFDAMLGFLVGFSIFHLD